LHALDYGGVLALACFVTERGLLANEYAPRVHNSGHWTIEGAETSQFEQHLRAITGMPLGSTDAVGVSCMLNCIGGMPDRAAVLAIPGTHWHTYDKAARAGRKVGHITVTAPTRSVLDDRRRAVESILATVEGADTSTARAR
jgi:5-(carboxyamino)imidazole ribonucleotide synthase